MSELTEKIQTELIKSGFPLEVFCKKRLEKRGWRCEGPTHVTLDDKVQELDIVASQQISFEKNLTAFFNIHVTCKKCSNNHWVFFKDQRVPTGVLVNSNFIDHLNIDVDSLESLSRFESTDTVRSKIYTMAFQAQKNQIYEAINELLSSYNFFRQFYGQHRLERKPEFNIVDVDLLTILLDGKLFAAEIGESEDLTVSEATHILYYHHEVEWPQHRHFTIEVVNKQYFDQYLDTVGADVQDLSRRIKQQLSV